MHSLGWSVAMMALQNLPVTPKVISPQWAAYQICAICISYLLGKAAAKHACQVDVTVKDVFKVLGGSLAISIPVGIWVLYSMPSSTLECFASCHQI